MPKLTDTSPDIAKKVSEIYSAMPAEKRIKMVFSMYDMAKNIVLSSLPKGLSPKEQKIEVFKRFYSSDFKPDELEKIIVALRKA